MPANDETSSAPAPDRRQHRRSKLKLAPDAAKRQGEVTKMAFETLGNKDAAIAYLNDECSSLGGRPLDIATGSAKGLQSVAHDLTRMSGARFDLR